MAYKCEVNLYHVYVYFCFLVVCRPRGLFNTQERCGTLYTHTACITHYLRDGTVIYTIYYGELLDYCNPCNSAWYCIHFIVCPCSYGQCIIINRKCTQRLLSSPQVRLLYWEVYFITLQITRKRKTNFPRTYPTCTVNTAKKVVNNGSHKYIILRVGIQQSV